MPNVYVMYMATTAFFVTNLKLDENGLIYHLRYNYRLTDVLSLSSFLQWTVLHIDITTIININIVAI